MAVPYAVILTGGKQYKVSAGDILNVELLKAEEGEEVTFEKVYDIGGGAAPQVTAKVLESGKGRKITVYTYKPKKGSQRKMGHRQPYTRVQITAV
ncbi:MAG: 50S ribosomal protein L21 [Oscillospiraceae bacterium]|jgi:large subunit ribosomal protein L21|nr:50S ribosomal protein L21 [Oscillospiraceae bacterium]